ncbi:C45 family autoproteolytic acyltransferase/hydolase [Yinghuangia seranimata]|uniref:C45 family autoproteolytic acyltransferase/hydolase n=1 Tax=Yinghuangia seranimata TaxID=408067 RepID=UPI00248C8781|nr:C45 family peptidase [Yinghuangia seranimata]MDI2127115.1 C45 family autoproteolytic acyltransferase/hydrolase [Yinghuangia seranimata]
MTPANPAPRRHVEAVAADPYRRGVVRGELLRDALPGTVEVYDRLFALGGVTPAQVRDDAERALDAVDRFRPDARAEIEGVAAGSGTELWRVAALNARTEVLARSTVVPPGECTTVVRRFAAPDGTAVGTLGVQTWDWHVELADHWHTLRTRGAGHAFVGLTENGILGKIGVNSAGLALHFNILGHTKDGVGGIPMHVLAAIVLGEAGSVAEAVELVRTAPVASSGSFALFDPTDAVLLDLSPVGVYEMRPHDGWLLRTNHFLTPAPAAHEKTWLYQPDSGERRDFVQARLAAADPTTPADLVDLLVTGPGEPPVTCLADPAQPLGQRWQSLATVTLDPATRTAAVLDGTPADAADGAWRTLTAG